MDLIKDLKKISDKVDKKIRKVNYGGCCVFASLATEHLQDLGLDVKIRVGDFGLGRRSQRKILNLVEKKVSVNTANGWYDEGVDMSHVVAEFGWQGKRYFFDAEGVAEKLYELEPFCNSKLHRGSIPLHVAKELALSTDWNPTFDRTQIPKLESLLKEEFSKLKAKYVAS